MNIDLHFTITFGWVVPYLLIGLGLLVLEYIIVFSVRDLREMQLIGWRHEPLSMLWSDVLFLIIWPWLVLTWFVDWVRS